MTENATPSPPDAGQTPAAISRRAFLKGTAAGAGYSVAAPWSPSWAHAGVSGLVRHYEAAVPNAHAQVALRLIATTPGFTPPVASRVLGYFGVTLYESLVPGMNGYRSLHGLLPGFPSTPTAPRSSMHWPTVANHALGTILGGLFPVNAPMLGEVGTLIDGIDSEVEIPRPIRSRSVDRGIAIANIVHEWAMTDGGHDGHQKNFPADFIPVTGPGLWEPTPPALQPIPLQPQWGNNREFADKGCVVPAPPQYSVDPASEFFAHATEVYNTSLTLTPQQAAIARFWADGPGTITPAGHSVSMLRQLLVIENASLEKAAEGYLRVGCAIADAFIQCWRTKYIWNLLRPITYIRANIDSGWSSLVTTPPFPEYSSGHSTQSGAWAEVMSSLFGGRFEFTDHTHDDAGLASRSFSSFREAAEEAAVSRLYGGIHFRFGNENGLAAGVCVGRAAADLSLRA